MATTPVPGGAASGRAPGAARQLEVELRVAPHAELLDGTPLERVEARPGVVEAAENGERQRQDHMIGPDALRPVGRFEVQGNPAIGLAPERAEPRVKPHRVLRKSCRDGPRQPVVAARDSEALVGHAGQGQPPSGRLLPEEVHEVERRLVGRRGAVLERVGDVEEPAEPRRRATRDARLDPLPDAHAVERHPRRRPGLVGRLLTRRGEISPEERIHRLELTIGVGDRVGSAQHVEGVLRAGRLGGVEIQGPETEASGEPQDRLMIGVDELPAPLADLAVPPVARRVRVDPAADLARGLVHGGGDAGIVKGQRSAEAPQTRPDDGHRGRWLSRRRLLRRRRRLRGVEPIGAERQPGRRRAAAQEECTPRDRARAVAPGRLRTPAFARSGPLGPDHGGRDAPPVRDRLDGREGHDRSSEWRPGHEPLLVVRSADEFAGRSFGSAENGRAARRNRSTRGSAPPAARADLDREPVAAPAPSSGATATRPDHPHEFHDRTTPGLL